MAPSPYAIYIMNMAAAGAAVMAEARRRAEPKALNEIVVHCRKYTIEEIEAATNLFTSLKLGEGHCGPVYKATLDHTPVALKIFKGWMEFKYEMETLSRVRHPNIVLLLGMNPPLKCLIYEFMDNGSLEDHLFRRRNGSSPTPPIPLRTRFKIAAEIATALLYLHRATPGPVLHLGLKPSNVLLDHNYATKINDPCRPSQVPTTVAHFWYVDPVFYRTGTLEIQSDVFSLGMVMLQIITAKPPEGLVDLVQRAVHDGRLADVLDPDLTDWPQQETLRFAILALRCVELRREDRPDLGHTLVPELNRFKILGHDIEDANMNPHLSITATTLPAPDLLSKPENINEDTSTDSSSDDDTSSSSGSSDGHASEDTNNPSSDHDTSTSSGTSSDGHASDSDWAFV